jgi:hypothetical protein
MAAYAVQTVQSPGSLKAFFVGGFTTAEVKAFIEAVNPVMYFVDSGDDAHIFVDGHAFDAARLDLIAEDIAAGAITVTPAATITIA